MRRFLKSLVLTTLLLTLCLVSPADEGMWLPHQMSDLNLQAQGLKMNPGDLYKKDGTGLMSAVVDLGGGTAEFVSSNGLMLTNHHVAFGAIQRASSKKNDYIEHGFLAKSIEEEIRAPGYNADVLLGYDDVTDKINKSFNSRMTPHRKFKAIEKVIKKLVAAEEKKAGDRFAFVRSMYRGNKYYMFKFKRMRDVRIVYAPPRGIGNFGGDIDNWLWPRHTGDFTYLRAYVSKEGEGIEFNKENVPYKPKVYFKIAKKGLKDGDFTFVMGYPGRTYRNYTVAEFLDENKRLKENIDLFKDVLDFFVKAGKDDREIQIKYASLDRGLNNALKNWRSKLEGFEKASILAKKETFEKKYLQWVNSSPERRKKYGSALEKIATFIEDNEAINSRTRTIGTMVGRGNALLSRAYTIYRWALESQKSDMKRERGFQKRDLPNIEMRLKLLERSAHLPTEQAFFKYTLKRYLKESKDLWPAALKPTLEKGPEAIDAFVDNLMEKTCLKDPKKRLELLDYSPAKLKKLNDPLIQLAAELEKELKVLREKMEGLGQERTDLRKVYLAALLEMKEGKLPPDANGTIRFTYGPVKGYYPKDAVTYTPLATLAGVVEKNTGKFPFDAPKKLVELWKKKDFGKYSDKELNDVVTCFLNTTNVTGGNSGSPTLNANGELVGLVFDMTYESTIGDYFIVPPLQRTIGVDIRYVLFVTEKFAGAHHLIKEMGL